MSEIELPSHWKERLLGDLTEVKGGKRLPKGHRFAQFPTPYPYIRVVDFFDYSINCSELKYLNYEDGIKLQNYIITSNDIYISIAGTIGRVGIIPKHLNGANLTENAARIIIKDKDILDKYYLALFLTSQRGENEINIRTTKTSQPKLAIARIKQIPIHLPPLPEQKSIVHTLRTIQKARETRQRELELERERKAALMQYLFTHGTRNEACKMKEVGDIPESWDVVKLEQFCEFLQYGTSKRCDKDSRGIPVLRIPNVIGGEIDTSDLKYIKPDKKEFDKLSLEIGDLLFVRTNGRKEYLGRCAVFSRKPINAMFASYLIRLRLKPNTLLPEFVQFYTMTHKGKSYLSGRASNAADGKFNINTQTIKAVLIPFPSLDEQKEIIETLQACDRKISSLEKEITILDELFHAMLEQLMTGKISTKHLSEIHL